MREPLDLHDHACLRPILTAMIRVENGRQPYSDAQIDASLVRAGVMPPQRSLQQTRTVKGGQVAAAGTMGAAAIGAIQETVGQAHEALVGVVPYLDAAKWGLLAVTLLGIGVMLWARIDDLAGACADEKCVRSAYLHPVADRRIRMFEVRPISGFLTSSMPPLHCAGEHRRVSCPPAGIQKRLPDRAAAG